MGGKRKQTNQGSEGRTRLFDHRKHTCGVKRGMPFDLMLRVKVCVTIEQQQRGWLNVLRCNDSCKGSLYFLMPSISHHSRTAFLPNTKTWSASHTAQMHPTSECPSMQSPPTQCKLTPSINNPQASILAATTYPHYILNVPSPFERTPSYPSAPDYPPPVPQTTSSTHPKKCPLLE